MEQGKQVWVAFANPEQQFHIAVAFIDGMTAFQARLKQYCRRGTVLRFIGL